MKFKVDRENFRKVLSVVKLAQGTGSISNNEWVKGIKIEVEGKDSLRLTATDTNAIISAVVDNVTIEEEGSILLNGDIIDKITSMQADKDLLLEVEDNMAKLSCGNDKSEFELMIDDFIGIDLSEAKTWFSLPAKSFLMANSDVSFAACKDSGTRPKMQGIYFESKNNSIDIVACDGRKLSKLVLKLDNIPYFGILVRFDIVAKISKALSDLIGVDGSVDMCITESKLFVRSSTFVASANLIDSKYINYIRIIPSSDNIKLSISCNKNDLLRKVNMAGFINESSKDSNGICNIGIKIGEEGFGEGCLSIVSYKSASNKQNSEISVIQEYGDIPEDFCIWVDYRNVLDVLKKFSSEKVFLDFIDCNSPFIIRDKDRENYLTLLMPQAKKG